ncbi:MAG: hypothetical protein ACKVQC_09415, partial [Elusimicrobiota bacterium]
GGLILTGWMKPLWYLIVLPEQLNLVFFLLAIPAILFGIFNSKLRPVFLWFAFSLIFFSLINNRNTRYSLPALPALAILSVAWIPSLFRLSYYFLNTICIVFFVMFQFFPKAWPPISLGRFTIPIIDRSPALAENWRHQEIINKISENLDSQKKFSKVVFVSNAPFFHSTSINVTARTMNIKDFSFQGPGKSRWLEFADFILWKTGDLGPAFTTGQVGVCAEFLSNPPDWFLKSYQVIGEWDLPDHSKAVLFQWKPKPMRIPDVGMLNLNLGKLALPHIQMFNVKLRAVPLNPQSTGVGKLKELLFSCESAKYKDFTFDHVSIKLINPQMNLPFFLETQEVSLASLEALELKTTLRDEGLLFYAKKKLKWLKEPQLEFQGSDIHVQGYIKGIPVKIIAQVKIEDKALRPSIVNLKLGPLSLPHFILNGLVNRLFSLAANREKPFDIRIQSIHGSGSKLTIE